MPHAPILSAQAYTHHALDCISPRLKAFLAQPDVLGIMTFATFLAQSKPTRSTCFVAPKLRMYDTDGCSRSSLGLTADHAAALADAAAIDLQSIAMHAERVCQQALENQVQYTMLLTAHGCTVMAQDTDELLEQWQGLTGDTVHQAANNPDPDVHTMADTLLANALCSLYVPTATTGHAILARTASLHALLTAHLTADALEEGPCSQFSWTVRNTVLTV